MIIWELHKHSIIRYNEFRSLLPDITQKMLTQQLKSLEANMIVKKKIYATTPPKVEYSLTETGEELIPVMLKMDDWGKDFVKKYKITKNAD